VTSGRTANALGAAPTPRVAFFTDSFHEVNGVALTSREFVSYAQRRSIPLFSVHAGPQNKISQNGSVTTFEFERGPARCNLEHDLAMDLLFFRHRARLYAELRKFQPDLVHITGPGDAGILGVLAAHACRLPIAASWHTNLHEFASTRLVKLLGALPKGLRSTAGSVTEAISLELCMRFYRRAKVGFAPNPELVRLLAKRTGRPAFLMSRGIDVNLFSPARRLRDDDAFVIGYVGRLSPEKNVSMFLELDRALRAAGLTGFRFLIVGEGSERASLRQNLPHAELPGILRGEQLARAYASMDAFVFPSFTDTFGNVVLEALASGVPAVVASAGGPKFLVENGRTGYVATTVREFAAAIARLYLDQPRRATMAALARKAAERFSWDRVIGEVYRHYDECFAPASAPKKAGALVRVPATR
jgi:phosphatidylinositol alpha 1,6-mannosyltransferase